MAKVITWEEVRSHNTRKDVWFVVEGKVYDVTKVGFLAGR
jgi:cytochrome b involved in lipid metabolism